MQWQPTDVQELISAAKDAISDMESMQVQIESEWGLCLSLQEMDDEGLLSPALLRLRAAVARMEPPQ